MKNKAVKIVIKATKSEIDALIGNFGGFSECAGFDQELIKVNQRNYENGTKFYFSEGVAVKVHSSLQAILDGLKYRNRSGSEFNAIITFKESLSHEFTKQTGKQINT